jgi:hypothetical protein
MTYNDSDYGSLINDDDTIKVAWAFCDEGKWGEYDPDDENDAPLLRFDVSYKRDGEWEPCDDASYCTNVCEDTDKAVLRRLLEDILTEVDGKVDEHGHGIKKVCEQLSWIGA